jgi:flagellar biosynthetic protein FliR
VPSIVLVQEGLQVFLLILTRIGAMLTTAPFWSSRTISPQVKIFFSLLLSLALLPMVQEQTPPITWGLPYVLLVVKETVLGLLLGVTSLILFHAIQAAGQIIDTQMGFGMVNVLDPQSGMQVPLLGNFFYLFATMLFLLSDGHHYLLMALTRSFRLIPPGTLSFPVSLWSNLGGLFTQILAFALQIALPVAGVLFLTDVALGIVARTVPQMNVFVLGIPVKILVGMGTILVTLPLFATVLRLLFQQIFANLELLLRAMGY